MFCIAFTPVLKETVVTFLLSFKDGRLKYLKKISVFFLHKQNTELGISTQVANKKLMKYSNLFPYKYLYHGSKTAFSNYKVIA